MKCSADKQGVEEDRKKKMGKKVVDRPGIDTVGESCENTENRDITDVAEMVENMDRRKRGR